LTLERIATLGVILASLAIVYSVYLQWRRTQPAAPPQVAPPSQPLSIEGAPTFGAPGATVAIVQFSDFQCPYCSQFVSEVLPAIKTKFVDTGDVKLVYRHFPLPIHPLAPKAAQAAECANAQGQFWSLHDDLYLNQRELFSPQGDFGEVLLQRASRLGLDTGAFTVCMQGPPPAIVASDLALGKSLGVRGTPAFFLGTVEADGRVKVSKVFTGVRPAADFERELTALLGKKRAD
jgi:protein-disulfide isomerase